MLTNYFRVARRNLVRHRVYSFINLGGLAVGMAVATLIGLWMHDELTFDTYHAGYDRIARVMEHHSFEGQKETYAAAAPAYGEALRLRYGPYFEHVLMASHPQRLILVAGDKKLMRTGYYFEPGVTRMLSLNMLQGTPDGLKDPASVLLSASVAAALFGTDDPVGKTLQLDDAGAVAVTGVYEDLPQSSSFADMAFVAPWSRYLATNAWIKRGDWWQNGFDAFVQVAPGKDVAAVSATIRHLKRDAVGAEGAPYHPELFLFPMSRWHLYADFEDGVNTGGSITFVRLFGIIGGLVLVLACINFMNLATARSGKRAKEVGIRKAIGSGRGQLVAQFLGESLLVTCMAFGLSLLLVQAALPAFSEVAGKKLGILWDHPGFWAAGLGFTVLTGLLAGGYPALYLSSFRPVQVLKGTFRAGGAAITSRRALVVVQFSVSIALLTGVILVQRQVQFAKDRPVGYDRAGLVMVETPTPDIHNRMDVVRAELKATGAVTEMSGSLNPLTGVSFTQRGYEWEGAAGQDIRFATVWVDHEFGRTVGWQLAAGRDFSRAFPTDSGAVVLNEAAVKVLRLQHPLGVRVRVPWPKGAEPFRVIGVIKDLLMESPYAPVMPTVYLISADKPNVVSLRLTPGVSTREALRKAEAVFRKHSPNAPFEYQFVDQAHNRKFAAEERVGRLAGFFAVLAVFISGLGVFGLASFLAEQRTKEIGIRKVLGASDLMLWRLLSKEFVGLVGVAFGIATPVAWYFLREWLAGYAYRTPLSPWMFGLAGLLALAVTVLSVSYQTIKAARTNPAKSLRSE
jgi:ABC-type lipoprotein release transport system permease subunit